MRRLLVIGIAFLTCPSSPCAAFFETGGESAKAVSVGGTLVSFAGDPDALWCNPAWLARAEQPGLRSTYSRPFGEVDEAVLGLAAPLGGRGGFGVGVSFLDGEGASEVQAVLGYGRALGGKLLVGGVAKLLRWSTEGSTDPVTLVKDEDLSATSFSVNAGIVWALGEKLGLGSVALSVWARDVIQPNISSSGGEEGKLPLRVRSGLLYERKGSFLGAMDYEYTDLAQRVHLGGELRVPHSDLAVRAGAKYDLDSGIDGGELSFGFGYGLQRWTFDYAYTYSPALLLDAHRVSVGYAFGRRVTK